MFWSDSISGGEAMLSRRQFLRQAAACTSFLTLSGGVPSLFVRAAEGAAKADRNDRVLVVIELGGGNDGLNTVVPFNDDLYYKSRPVLAIPHAEVIRLNDQVGLHPSMGPAGELFRAGKFTIVQGVGYPQTNRSHFRSMEIWQTASLAQTPPSSGWLGRVLDREGATGDGRVAGVAFTEPLPQALQSQEVSVPVLHPADKPEAADGSGRQRLLRRLITAPGANAEPVAFIRRQAAINYRITESLRQAADNFKSEADYPGELGAQLRRAAQVVMSDLGVRLLYLSQGGYDTHSQQASVQAKLLGDLAGSLAAFQKDLEKHRVADRVLVMAFSEFGRRVEENASQGTDHGAASCLFLAGSRLKGGLAGSYPSLAKLADGDLIFNVDFRSVYATVLEGWFGCPPDELLAEKFPRLALLQS
jgi:uncharacterized protein (DUF1501 family)